MKNKFVRVLALLSLFTVVFGFSFTLSMNKDASVCCFDPNVGWGHMEGGNCVCVPDNKCPTFCVW